jgi:DNA-binding LacI/PurR family transcriptional regulator
MPETTERLTISRVAEEAGVSTQTVSRVLNDRPDVAPETRQRVKDVIARLGYQPSAIARSLVNRQSHTLGLITADFSDYFFTQVIAGAEIEARKHGYYLMLSSTERNPEEEREYFRLLSERRVDGILFARPSAQLGDPQLLSLINGTIPVVTTSYLTPGTAPSMVHVDNIDGGRQATRCLLSGRRHIALIAGPSSKPVGDRTTGYRLALEEAGVAYDPSLVAEGDWSYESGYHAMRTLLGRGARFSGVFAVNDQMAIGAIRALHEAGRMIPDDVAVVGYDDIPVAAYYEPSLTTIRQPMREVGVVATRLLIQTIEEEEAISNQEILLKTELVRRVSCP